VAQIVLPNLPAVSYLKQAVLEVACYWHCYWNCRNSSYKVIMQWAVNW